MFVRGLIAVFIYMMAQAVLFGIGVIVVLSTPLSAHAHELIYWVTGVSAIIAIPIAWRIALILRNNSRKPVRYVPAAQ